MKRACIVTVDAARARIFLYQEQAKPGFEVTEYKDLVNAGRRLKAGEMFSESRPTSAQQGGVPYDDHRDAHIEEMDAKFAKEIVETVRHVLHDKQMGHLILCAPPKMMGALRAAGGLDRPELRVDELALDLSKLTLAHVHDQLAARDLIPPRARLAVAR